MIFGTRTVGLTTLTDLDMWMLWMEAKFLANTSICAMCMSAVYNISIVCMGRGMGTNRLLGLCTDTRWR